MIILQSTFMNDSYFYVRFIIFDYLHIFYMFALCNFTILFMIS